MARVTELPKDLAILNQELAKLALLERDVAELQKLVLRLLKANPLP